MVLIAKDTLRKAIHKKFDYLFAAPKEGLYIIEVSARARGEKQVGKDATDDDDLRIELDGRKFPKLDNPSRYADSPAAFSGGQLHNLKKTVFFFVQLSEGKHTVSFVPDGVPRLEEITIEFAGNNSSNIVLDTNQRAEDGDRRPWMTFVLVDISLSSFAIQATVTYRFIDSDEVKVMVNGVTQTQAYSSFYRFWLFAGSLAKKLSGATESRKEELITALPRGLHYIELWADRMPTLLTATFHVGENVKRIPTVYDPLWTGDFHDDTEQMILARAIFGEARDVRLSDRSRIAVGWTIKNRVYDKWRWGDTYREVILQAKQYSALNEGDPNLPYVKNPFQDPAQKRAWFRCYDIAGNVMNNLVDDPTDGANHYYSDNIGPPFWTKKKEAHFKITIDTLHFYDIKDLSQKSGKARLAFMLLGGLFSASIVLWGASIATFFWDEYLWNKSIHAEVGRKAEIVSRADQTISSTLTNFAEKETIEIAKAPLESLHQDEYSKIFYQKDGKSIFLTYRGREISYLVFSPSKNKMSFYYEHEDPPVGRDVSLVVMDIPRRKFREVYKGSYHTSNLEWLNEDELVVYYGCGTECMVGFVVDVKTGKRKAQLQYGVGYEWSPDKKLALAYNYSGEYGITVGNKKGKELFALRRDLPDHYSKLVDKTKTAWSPDGSKIALIIKKENQEALELMVVDVKKNFQTISQSDISIRSSEKLSWSNDSKKLAAGTAEIVF